MPAILIDSKGNTTVEGLKQNLKVEINMRRQGFVRLKTRHDSLKFASKSPHLLEKRYLTHEGPNTKQVTVKVDVLKAVRLVKHIREGYEAEKQNISAIFNGISSAIMLIERHNKKSGQCDEDLDLAVSLLNDVISKMKGTRAFYKVISKIKVQNAIGYVNDAHLAENDFDMNKHLKPAVSILFAAKRRLEVRLESIGRIKNYNGQREMLLRGLRDYYIWDRLAYLTLWIERSPRSAIDAYMQDMNLYNRMLRLRDRCEAGEASEAGKRLHFKNDFAALGIALKKMKGKEFAVDRLRDAYTLAIKEGKRDDACDLFDKTVVFLGMNKPFYIAAQLEETGDEYTRLLVTKLKDVDKDMLTHDSKSALQNLAWVMTFYSKIFAVSTIHPESFDELMQVCTKPSC